MDGRKDRGAAAAVVSYTTTTTLLYNDSIGLALASDRPSLVDTLSEQRKFFQAAASLFSINQAVVVRLASCAADAVVLNSGAGLGCNFFNILTFSLSLCVVNLHYCYTSKVTGNVSIDDIDGIIIALSTRTTEVVEGYQM